MSSFDQSFYDMLVLTPFSVFVLMTVLLWDSLGRALREQRVKSDVLRAELEVTQRERDHFRDAWAKVQVRLDCSVDAADALREERAAVVAYLRMLASYGGLRGSVCGAAANCIERGEHRRTGENE